MNVKLKSIQIKKHLSSILPTESKVFQFSDPTQIAWITCLQIKLRVYANISCHVFNVLNDMAETNVRFCLLIIYFILWSIYDHIFQVIGLYTGRGQYGIKLYQKLCTGCTTARKQSLKTVTSNSHRYSILLHVNNISLSISYSTSIPLGSMRAVDC